CQSSVVTSAASPAGGARSSVASRGWPFGHAVGVAAFGREKPSMQAEQNQLTWPSGHVCLRVRLICTTVRVAAGFGALGARVLGAVRVVSVATGSSPWTVQKRHPLQATPFMTALPAAEGLVN